MNSTGNMMMAKGILTSIGFTVDELKTIESEWVKIPNTNEIRVSLGLSHAELTPLQQAAKVQGKTLQQLFDETIQNKKAELMKP